MDSVLGIVGILVGVAGVVVGYLGYRVGWKQGDQRIGYRIDSYELVGEVADPTGRIKVVYEDPEDGTRQDVERATLSSVRLVNIGSRGVEGYGKPNSDVKGGPIGFRFESSELIGGPDAIELSATSLGRIQPHAHLTADGVFIIDFDHLKSGDSIEATFLHSGDSSIPSGPAQGELLSGEMTDLGESESRQSRRSQAVAWVFVGLLGILTGAILALTIRSSFDQEQREQTGRTTSRTETTSAIEEYEILVVGPVDENEARHQISSSSRERRPLPDSIVLESILSQRPNDSDVWASSVSVGPGWYVVEVRRLGDTRNEACTKMFETKRSESSIELRFRARYDLRYTCGDSLDIVRSAPLVDE